MSEQIKNILIGAFIIIACSLFVSFVMFLRPSVGDEKQTLLIRFSDINKIGIGTRILFAGRPVGEVVAIQELPDTRHQRVDSLGRVYVYQLVAKVDSGVKIYNNDEVQIQTSGLLGEKSIGIIPKAPVPGETPKLITDQPIYANSVDPLDNALSEISSVANEMERTFKLAGDWIEKNSDSLGKAVDSFGATMDEAKTALQQLRENKTYAHIGEIANNLKITTGQIAEGKGTLGKLINQDDLYLHVSSILNKVDTLLGDINHYGLLFHLNKGWQRTRLARINTLNALETPQGFRSYFEEEVNQINLSMSRLSLLVEKAEQSPDPQVMESSTFKTEAHQLLQKAQELSENLKLFNQQLVDMKQ